MESLTPFEVEPCFCATQDGWEVPLYHLTPENRNSPHNPIILAHGLGTNRFNLAPPIMEVSFTEYLRARGHDVWAIELRGAGRARYKGGSLFSRTPNYDFTDYVKYDLPALLDGLAQRTLATQFHWVGHSMGGWLGYAAAMLYGSERFTSLTAIASPAVTANQHFALRNAYPLRPLLKALRFVPAALAGQAGKLAPSIGAFAMNFLLANGKLIEPQYLKRLAPLALSPVSTKLIDQIAGWFDHNRNHPLELGWQWDNLANVTTPVLALAGSVDQLAPEHNVRELLGRVSSTDKNLLVCGKHTGFSADFGHIDIMLSTPARLEIYPRIAQWLESHRAADDTVQRGQQEVVQLHPSNRRTHAGALTDTAG